MWHAHCNARSTVPCSNTWVAHAGLDMEFSKMWIDFKFWTMPLLEYVCKINWYFFTQRCSAESFFICAKLRFFFGQGFVQLQDVPKATREGRLIWITFQSFGNHHQPSFELLTCFHWILPYGMFSHLYLFHRKRRAEEQLLWAVSISRKITVVLSKETSWIVTSTTKSCACRISLFCW